LIEPAELRAWRRAQRAAITAARAALDRDERRRASAAIESYLAEIFADRRGGIVAAYWPIRDEFDVLPFVERLRGQGVTPALPVVVAKDEPLEFRAWNAGEPLARGVFDIAYPSSGVRVRPGALIVPLLGFDDAGSRLGYGAGFYDRTIAELQPKPLVVGVGFECGRLATIHPQPHDVPMDVIVTEAGIFRNAR
jgi:5-formyltetrahydrofolate cyclo-ligase